MKIFKSTIMVLFILVLASSFAFGYSSHSTTISRTFDKYEAYINDNIIITVQFTNLDANALRGFYYTEHIPQGLTINIISAKLNGVDISNYLQEAGSTGDVYAGSTPYRWVLELPPSFGQNNSIIQNSAVEIVYSVSSAQEGTFSFNEFNWIGYYQTAPEGGRSAFGHSEDIDKQTITFTTNPVAPAANFAGNPSNGMAPLTVNFTDQSTGDITEWSWDFGDISPTNNEQNPTHTYDDPGIYTVNLTVTGPGGTDTDTKIDYITVTVGPIPPVADFSGTPTTGTVPLEVFFVDTSTGQVTGWSWDFGDTSPINNEQNSAHTYNDPGIYTVSLTVTGPGGTDAETKTDYITVAVPTPYHLAVNTIGFGSVTLEPAGGTYDSGTEVQLTPVPDVGWASNGWSGDLTGYSNPAIIVMNSDKTITATFDEDGDADGISDAEEDAGPNNGNGNFDNEQDSDQQYVATFHTQDGTNYVTLESAAGTTLANCSAVSIPNAPGAPSDATFPYGFFNFIINGVTHGGDTTLILYLPTGANINTYWKFGPTPINSNPHWYEFMYDPATQTGAVINGNIITLHFIDGERGDDVITADGILIDQGGPGTYGGSSGGSSDESGGGGCFVRTASGK